MLELLRLESRSILAVVSGGHFVSHFYKLTLPPLFPFLEDDFGLSNTELGLVVTVVAVGGLLQAPVGRLVDRVGAKWIFVAGVGVTAGGIALIAAGPNFPVLLALSVVSGVGQAAFHPADYALIGSVTGSEVRGRAFSLHTFSGYAGAAAAPVVVGSLAVAVGWQLSLVVVGSVGLLYTVFAGLFFLWTDVPNLRSDEAGTDSETSEQSGVWSVLRKPGILAIAFLFLVLSVGGKGLQSFTPLLAVNVFSLSETVGNYMLTAFFALGSVGVLAGGILADRYPPGRIIGVSLLIGSVVLVLTITGVFPVQSLPLVALFGAIGFLISLVTPARDRLVNEASGPGEMGQSFGIVFTGSTVGALAGPVIVGSIADLHSLVAAFVLIAVFYLFAAGLAVSIGGKATPLGGAPGSGGS